MYTARVYSIAKLYSENGVSVVHGKLCHRIKI